MNTKRPQEMRPRIKPESCCRRNVTVESSPLLTDDPALRKDLLTAACAVLEERFENSNNPCAALLLSRAYRVRAQEFALSEGQRGKFLQLSAHYLGRYKESRWPKLTKELPSQLELTLEVLGNIVEG